MVEPNWLDSVGIREGKLRCTVHRCCGLAAFAIVVSVASWSLLLWGAVSVFRFIFVVGVEWCVCSKFNNCGPHGANKQNLTMAGDESMDAYQDSTVPTPSCEPFNVEKSCPHPSLGGRGDVVVVGNATLALEQRIFWNETRSAQKNI